MSLCSFHYDECRYAKSRYGESRGALRMRLLCDIKSKQAYDDISIDIERKYRLLKVCYVPATSSAFLAFFFFFFM